MSLSCSYLTPLALPLFRGKIAASSFTHHTVVVGVVHVLICRMSTANRGNAVVARLRAGDAAITVVVVCFSGVEQRGSSLGS